MKSDGDREEVEQLKWAERWMHDQQAGPPTTFCKNRQLHPQLKGKGKGPQDAAEGG